MPIDREATLKKAEKLLRQGKLDGAIAEYVRLVEEQPKDWSSVNALGDLYARAGQVSNASTQFVRIADHLFDEGFLPKAAALYKKTLKITPDDEHTLQRLAEIATRQGVFVDAKTFYRQLADRRRKRGDERGAKDVIVLLGDVDPADAEAKTQAAAAAKELGDPARARAFLVEAADAYEKQKRGAEVVAALREAVALDPEEAEVRGRLLTLLVNGGQLDDAREVARTSSELLRVASALEEGGRGADALDLLARVAELEPDDRELRIRLVRAYVAAGNHEQARRFLSEETAGDDPELLLTLARIDLESGRLDEGRGVLQRLLALQPAKRDELVLVGCELADQGKADAAFACVDVVADAAVALEDWGGAAAALHEFVTRVPNQIPALMKLVEICVDGGLESTMYMAQAQLADAYLAAGLGSEARVIAEDLVAREPWVRANLERFRRSLILLGVADPDAIIAERLSGDSPFLSTIDLPDEGSRATAAAAPQEAAAAPAPVQPEPAEEAPADVAPEPPPFPAADLSVDLLTLPPVPEPTEPAPVVPPAEDESESLVLESLEVDLSDALTGDAGPRAGDTPPLQDVFDDLRGQASRQSQVMEAQAQYAAAVDHAREGRMDQAIAGFEAAARIPMLRFRAGAGLGRLHLGRGDLTSGVEWLERAAEAPAPTLDEGHALLYDLADALERLGEHARALAVLMELSADAGEYRDTTARIDRLAKAQTGR